MSLTLKALLFILVSVGLIWLSRRSLKEVRSHGFYRFFAWESSLGLVLVNLDHWFRRPFSLPQVISWSLIIICLCLLIHSVLLLSRLGKPDKKRDDPSLIGIEKTTRLVTEGVYRYIRHPIYSAGMIGIAGIFLKNPSFLSAGLSLLAVFFFIMTARREETENLRFFGAAYHGYQKQTRMFVPFLF